MNSIKKILVNIIAALLLVVSCFAMTACTGEDIVQVELTVSVYNYGEDLEDDTDDEGVDEYTLTVDLYRHLAPNTVDQILKYVKAGYYNDTVFYQIDGADNLLQEYPNQIMLGDLKLDGAQIVQNDIMPTIKGEFEKGGTTGSNLTAKVGSIGLWRSWYDFNDQKYDVQNGAMNSGRATWFMPTSTQSAYNGWFCFFGQFNTSSEAYELIKTAVTHSSNIEEYVIYYTGEYDKNGVDNNNGLTFNCVPVDDYDAENIDGLFEVENDDELVCYNPYTVQIPVDVNGNVTAKVVSVKVK